MRVAVLGAGPAGLAAARHVLASEARHTCVVFERSSQVGGTWVYTDSVGVEDDGLPVYTSLYKGLMTNSPKEIMGYPDYPITEPKDSYLRAADVLQFFNDYTDEKGLRTHIKFNRHVERVNPIGDQFEVSTRNTTTKEMETEKFDYVLICTGQFWAPFMPQFEGASEFAGRQLHCHDYRSPETFSKRKVLIVGGGFSAADILNEMGKVADQIVLSHHLEMSLQHILPSNAIEKPDVQLLNKNSVIFKDGTSAEIDDIIYATGYQFSFPFLTPECGISAEPFTVRPLYKYMINVNNPRLIFVGMAQVVNPCTLFDLQARYIVAFLDGKFELPPKEVMLSDIEKEYEENIKSGFKAHVLFARQEEYYKYLIEMSQSTPLRPVIAKLCKHILDAALKKTDYRDNKFRTVNYKIIDDENFQEIK